MSVFPMTSMTLLEKIAVEITGEREAAWIRFFDLYTPAIRKFVEWHDSTHDPDDVIQDIYIKLVDVVQRGKYDPSKGNFRSFLSAMIRNHLISLYRKDAARGWGMHVNIDDVEIVDNSDVALEMDAKWMLARRQSAIEHVLTKTAMTEQTRKIYQAYVIDELPVDEVESRFGVNRNYIYKIKSRIEKMAAIIERELGD
jgi:RNA polymerase sigma-70 factor (ECF subfamily)